MCKQSSSGASDSSRIQSEQHVFPVLYRNLCCDKDLVVDDPRNYYTIEYVLYAHDDAP